MISHPQSPFQGQRYTEPVELIDIYPTVLDLVRPPNGRDKTICKGDRCLPLQGKSLAPVVLGVDLWEKNYGATRPRNFVVRTPSSTTITANGKAEATKKKNIRGSAASGVAVTTVGANGAVMPTMIQTIAISQHIRCAKLTAIAQLAKMMMPPPGAPASASHKPKRKQIWLDCDVHYKKTDELSLMGYSMRSSDYRYTGYFYYNRTTRTTDFDRLPYQQELFDHKNETLSDFTHREIVNLAAKPSYAAVVNNQRLKLVDFLKKNIVPAPR